MNDRPLTPDEQKKAAELVPLAERLAGLFGPDDEFLSEAYLALCRAIPKHEARNGSSLKTFVGTCIYRSLVNLLRKQKTKLRRAGVLPQELPAADSSAYIELSEIIAALPRRYRRLAYLRWERGWTLRRLANRYQTSKPAISRRLRVAARMALEFLESKGG